MILFDAYCFNCHALSVQVLRMSIQKFYKEHKNFEFQNFINDKWQLCEGLCRANHMQ